MLRDVKLRLRKIYHPGKILLVTKSKECILKIKENNNYLKEGRLKRIPND